jgi:hypothetical protein
VTNAKCLNGDQLKIVLNKHEVPRTADKINIRCQICEDKLEAKEYSLYIICPKKTCGQYFCEHCVS